MVSVAVVPENGILRVHTSSRSMKIKWNDLNNYFGDRALRGSMLPKGWRKVERIEVISK